MQTVLLAREIVRMMRWDGDSKSDTHHFASVKRVNHHFDCVTELHRTMGYIGNLSIEDVLKSVTAAGEGPGRMLRFVYCVEQGGRVCLLNEHTAGIYKSKHAEAC